MSEANVIRVSYPSAKAFVDMLTTLSELVDEVLMKVTPEGISIKALDPARVSLLSISLPPDVFLEYEVPSPIDIGMSISSLIKILPKPKKGDKLTIQASEDFFDFIIEGLITRRYRFRNLQVAEPEIPSFNLEFTVEGTVLAEAMKIAIKDISDVSDTMRFIAETEDYLLVTSGDRRTKLKISRATGSLVNLIIKERSEAAYDIDYLSKVIKLTGIAESIDFQFGTDMPIDLKFRLLGGGEVEYLLAPKGE
ncbi:MAG TPA: DNA polymerase sliding clamp [Acidilobales archaeon]|nr:MAG: DNA polymerase sliding clamp [Desulfurococcales archaeon ex4484_42]HDD26566.1 DNA polymerase sliding clamp [Acidilobales archaeon]